MNPRESQLEARLIGCERLLLLYQQELVRLRRVIEEVLQTQGQVRESKAVTT